MVYSVDQAIVSISFTAIAESRLTTIVVSFVFNIDWDSLVLKNSGLTVEVLTSVLAIINMSRLLEGSRSKRRAAIAKIESGLILVIPFGTIAKKKSDLIIPPAVKSEFVETIVNETGRI